MRAEKKEEERLKQQEMEEAIDDVLTTVIANAVFEAEYKKHGCRCLSNVKKQCHCECKCNQWCKCCKCYKTSCKKSTRKS